VEPGRERMGVYTSGTQGFRGYLRLLLLLLLGGSVSEESILPLAQVHCCRLLLRGCRLLGGRRLLLGGLSLSDALLKWFGEGRPNDGVRYAVKLASRDTTGGVALEPGTAVVRAKRPMGDCLGFRWRPDLDGWRKRNRLRSGNVGGACPARPLLFGAIRTEEDIER
jgi:hypothetical protein